MESFSYFDYPVGRIGIAAEDGFICGIYLLDEKIPESFTESSTSKDNISDIILKADKQLNEYFAGKRKDFDLPLKMHGTDFQKSVWEALLTIPYGETKSYKDIAVQIGNEKACRAVGMANNRNPISIVVPCHRVIGHDGTLVGYGGGLEVKQKLLDLEQGAK